MKSAIITFSVALACSAYAQGTFQNLNFENANIVPIVGSPYYPYAVTVANALPGWAVFYGTVQQTQILYNDPAIGSTAVTLCANGYPGYPGPIIDGNFSLLLQGGVNNDGVPTSASINQTGLIPLGTQSLLFDAISGVQPNEAPEVFIGNQSLSVFEVGSQPNYNIFAADISAWAGQTEQLTFSSPGGNFEIDDISFSTQAVPEPGPFALTGLAGALFAAYRRFAPKRK